MLTAFYILFGICVAIIAWSVTLGLVAYRLSLYWGVPTWFAAIIGIAVFIYFSKYFDKK